jgi:hypothetical protein
MSGAWGKACRAAGQTARESQAPRSAPASVAVPVAEADNLRRLPAGDLLGHGSHNYFLYLHRPLHRGLRVGNLLCMLLPSPPAKRTDHLLTQPEISCANDTQKKYLTTVINRVYK